MLMTASPDNLRLLLENLFEGRALPWENGPYGVLKSFHEETRRFLDDELPAMLCGLENTDRVLEWLTAFFAPLAKSSGQVQAAAGDLHHPTLHHGDVALGWRHADHYFVHSAADISRRQGQDVFIHKDLGGFLRALADAFWEQRLATQAVTAEDDELSGLAAAARGFQQVAHRAIALFCRQETLAKQLWLCKRRVIDVQYGVTLDRVPEALYDDILNNPAQWEQWRSLYALEPDEPPSIGFLVQHPYLMVDTALFSPEFKAALVASFPDVDKAVDGVLVHSDNFQALNLMERRYRRQVDAIYIDPPYNTCTASAFVYKNGYSQSAWLTMMHNRLEFAPDLLSPGGVMAVAIDDYELQGLSYLMDAVLGAENKLGNVVVLHNPGGRHDDRFIATAHEYMLLYAADVSQCRLNNLPLSEEDVDTYQYEDELGRYRLREFRRSGSNSRRENRPNMYYPVYVHPQTLELSLKPEPGMVEVLPVDPKGVVRVWRWGPETFLAKKDTEIVVKSSEKGFTLWAKKRLEAHSGKKPKSLWNDSRYSAALGTHLVKEMVGDSLFSYPKSLNLVTDALRISCPPGGLVMDFFAGSGTAAHAVIALNREDGGRRKYVLVEAGPHFESVIKPRIERAVYAAGWKAGKPQDTEGIGHVVKRLRLESYADSLENLVLSAPDEADFPWCLASTWGDDPFEQRIKVLNGSREARWMPVDWLETFNWLLGLRVQRISEKVFMSDDTGLGCWFQSVEGCLPDGSPVLILWRNLLPNKQVSQALLENYLQQNYPNLQGFSALYVNGPHGLSGMPCPVYASETVYRHRALGLPAVLEEMTLAKGAATESVPV